MGNGSMTFFRREDCDYTSSVVVPAYDTPSSVNWGDLDKRKFYVIGPCLFLGVRGLVYPSNLVKTRLQLQPKEPTLRLYKNTYDAFRKVKRQEGYRGFYKGFSMNSVGILTGNIFITFYEVTKSYYLTYAPAFFGSSSSSSSSSSNNSFRPERYANFVAGAVASVLAQTVVVPVDIISQHLMIDSSHYTKQKIVRTALTSASTSTPTSTPVPKTNSSFHICRSIYAKEGIMGFYRGYILSIATYAPSSALWWGAYGTMYPIYYQRLPSSMDPSYRLVLAQAIAGCTSGMLSAMATNPMDVLRTRAQVYAQKSILETLRHLVRTNGLRGLWSGTSARILAMSISGTLAISTYELVKRLSLKDKELTCC